MDWGIALGFLMGVYLIAAGIFDWQFLRMDAASLFCSRAVNRALNIGIGILVIVMMLLVVLDVI